MLNPKPVAAVVDVVALSAAAGSEMVKACDVTQELASVTVTVFVPADKPMAVAAVPPEGAQL